MSREVGTNKRLLDGVYVLNTEVIVDGVPFSRAGMVVRTSVELE